MSVIIIDDDNDVLDSLQELLESQGIEILGTADDGKKGAELYSIMRPNVVLLDLMMPNYDGFYGFKAIRKINPDAKIIITTGNPEQAEILQISFSDVEVLRKPYPIDVLINKINSMTKDCFPKIST